MTTISEIRILGITDEQTECDRCGRVELRCTVILADADGAEMGRYGTTCATKVLGRSVTATDARRAESYRRSLLRDAYVRARKAKEAGDVQAMEFHIRECRRIGLIRPNEFRAIDNLIA